MWTKALQIQDELTKEISDFEAKQGHPILIEGADYRSK
jgi:hypothetical protein